MPTKEEIRTNILRPLQKLSKEQFWINPDCGLKTRAEKETIEALEVLDVYKRQPLTVLKAMK